MHFLVDRVGLPEEEPTTNTNTPPPQKNTHTQYQGAHLHHQSHQPPPPNRRPPPAAPADGPLPPSLLLRFPFLAGGGGDEAGGAARGGCHGGGGRAVRTMFIIVYLSVRVICWDICNGVSRTHQPNQQHQPPFTPHPYQINTNQHPKITGTRTSARCPRGSPSPCTRPSARRAKWRRKGKWAWIVLCMDFCVCPRKC